MVRHFEVKREIRMSLEDCQEASLRLLSDFVEMMVFGSRWSEGVRKRRREKKPKPDHGSLLSSVSDKSNIIFLHHEASGE